MFAGRWDVGPAPFAPRRGTQRDLALASEGAVAAGDVTDDSGVSEVADSAGASAMSDSATAEADSASSDPDSATGTSTSY